MQEGIRYFSYKMRKGQFLSQAIRDKSKDCAAKLLNKLTKVVNLQNNRWLALFAQDISILVKTKHPVHVTEFVEVTSDDNILHPFIFPHSFRLNSQADIKYLEDVVLIWIKRVAPGRPYIWQQDSAPYHTSRRTQSWLSENFCDQITSSAGRLITQISILLIFTFEA